MKFIWEYPDPNDIAGEFFMTAERWLHAEAFTEVAKEYAVVDMEHRFEEEVAPDGTPWRYWADSYAPWAEAHNIGILRRQPPTLYDAATDWNAYKATPEGLYFDTSGLPEYWEFHEEGTIKMEARPFIGLSDEAMANIEREFIIWATATSTTRLRSPAGLFRSAGI